MLEALYDSNGISGIHSISLYVGKAHKYNYSLLDSIQPYIFSDPHKPPAYLENAKTYTLTLVS